MDADRDAGSRSRRVGNLQAVGGLGKSLENRIASRLSLFCLPQAEAGAVRILRRFVSRPRAAESYENSNCDAERS